MAARPAARPVRFSLLQRTCKLVVLLSLLHISVTVFFYVCSLDIRFSFVQNQQSKNESSAQAHRVRDKDVTSGTEPKVVEVKKDQNRDQNRDQTRDQNRDQNRDQTRDQNRDQTRDQTRDQNRDQNRDQARDQARDQNRDQTRDQTRDQNRDQTGPPLVDQTRPPEELDKCPETSPLLVGPLRVEFSSPVDLDQVRKQNPDVVLGGRFRPRDCVARTKVAIIIPFRKREEHLKFWLYYLHPILQRQQLDYGVYVINQDGDQVFNRAKLLNVGYREALKEYDYECFVFSDVDLIPMDDRNIYSCFSQPRHLSVSMDKFGFRLPYNQYFGGVSSMSKEQYMKINGFPNNYWGWGGEDDDIFNRLSSKGMSISRPSGDVGKCRMIRHDRDKQNDPNPQRFDRIAHTRDTMHRDGISSLSYRVLKTEKLDLFTKITVDVGQP